jgi:hypothetical protein
MRFDVAPVPDESEFSVSVFRIYMLLVFSP